MRNGSLPVDPTPTAPGISFAHLHSRRTCYRLLQILAEQCIRIPMQSICIIDFMPVYASIHCIKTAFQMHLTSFTSAVSTTALH